MKKTKSSKQAIEDLTAAVLVNTIFLAVQSKDTITSDDAQNEHIVNTVLALWNKMRRTVS